jgi:hypothetical protein
MQKWNFFYLLLIYFSSYDLVVYVFSSYCYLKNTSQLTGLWPFYETNDDQVIQSMVEDGKRPHINHLLLSLVNTTTTATVPILSNETTTAVLIKIMQQCWHPDPKQRPDIFTIVQTLQGLLIKNQ